MVETDLTNVDCYDVDDKLVDCDICHSPLSNMCFNPFNRKMNFLDLRSFFIPSLEIDTVCTVRHFIGQQRLSGP